MNYDKSFCVTRNAKMYVTLGGLYIWYQEGKEESGNKSCRAYKNCDIMKFS